MPNSEERTLAQDLNAWVQTIGIVIATVWGVYTFVYKEVVVPKSVPINITLNLDLKEIGSGGQKTADSGKQLIPVQLKISARNPSTRTVYLLPSEWTAWGYRVSPKDKPEPIHDFQITRDTSVSYVEMHAGSSESDVIGVGGLFGDTSLRPDEVITRTLIFYVPPNKYDEIWVNTLMPTVVKDKAVDLEWKLNDKTQTVEPTMYRLGPKGERKEMKRDPDGGYSDPKLDLEMASSDSALSLWQ